jgi:phage replication-related protein YjqB (UPF0714/DUF867 family)
MNKYGIIAIHGGKIERGTSEIAKNIAGNDIEYFNHSGETGSHITSNEFQSPLLDKLLSECSIVISIHGQHDREKSFVIVGGLYNELIFKIKEKLKKNNFQIKDNNNTLRGILPDNVCNKGISQKGVQLEISYKLRMDLLNDKNLMNLFVDSVGNCL